MAAVVFTEVDQSVITPPATGKASMFIDETNLVSLKLSTGVIVPVGGGSVVTTEMIADLQAQIDDLKARVTALGG